MNYHRIDTFDTANSHGLATVLWLSGCSHHCKDCHNPETWDSNSGKKFDDSALRDLFWKLENEHCPNFVLSGGDPLFTDNLEEVHNIIGEIRRRFPKKKIILYTGYTLNEILKEENTLRLSIVYSIDYLIDGRFDNTNKVKGIDLRGSYNQKCYLIENYVKFTYNGSSIFSSTFKATDISKIYFRDTVENDRNNFMKSVIL